MFLFAGILISRLFVLQIVQGEKYQANYDLRIEKTESIEATRGKIFDRKGVVLAYNDLAYAVTIKDEDEESDHSIKLNERLYNIIKNIEKNGDKIDNDFGIRLKHDETYEFILSGTNLMRFRADIFGRPSINDLTTNTKLGYEFNEAEADADQIMAYLKKLYDVDDKYETKYAYRIIVVRYRMWLNRYQKYMATTIASNVNQKTVAYIKENSNELIGADIKENSIRRYVDPEAFANILGYTGTISPEEYRKASEKDDTVTLNDIVGKSGIEQVLDKSLAGKKGYRKIYADSSGKMIKVTESKNPKTGNDVYLSINHDLQVAAYKLLEKEIAGILYSKIENIKYYNPGSNASASDIVVPIYEVYYALINNNLLDLDLMNTKSSSDVEKNIYKAYKSRKDKVLKELESQLTSSSPKAYNTLSDEFQDYSTYLVKKLRADGVLKNDLIDVNDPTYKKWQSEKLSVKEYISYALQMKWIDISSFTKSSKYVDTDETYMDLVKYIIEDLSTTKGFAKIVCHYAILDDEISGASLCAALYDQGVLKKNKSTRDALLNGSVRAYDFLKSKIHDLEITPGELALDPCSGSTVITDINTGEILACVTYPGYDNNKLANGVDSDYYTYLNLSLSNPLYNHATQQKTAPGSTFKPCSSVAGLCEGVITTTTKITDKVTFEKVSNHPKCWIYPRGSHGTINLAEAIRDSCNYYFYEVGWRLAGGDNNYNDAVGIKKIQKYASLFGLNEKTGVEIEENTSDLATEFPVMAAMGQSNHNFTTIALARYATAIANNGKVFKFSLLDHVQNAKGKVTKKFGAEVVRDIDVLDQTGWNAIHKGMRMVVTESLPEYTGFPLAVAGKTGTAQEDKTRPNHALFIGYAPYDNPKVAIATRIANGYTSHNAADVSRNILGVYFGVKSSKELLKSNGITASSSNSGNTD
ncbi:MAG: peptidoglycan glycosyltransferase [Lachnospiraceae bacterium]|nr:peptidoglycan glycosyltransferase [Lachnospiraceae bacterium]